MTTSFLVLLVLFLQWLLLWMPTVDSSANGGGGVEGFLDCSRSVFWLHTPKTASTFCLSLQHLCCPYHFYGLTRDVSMDMLLDQILIDDHKLQNMSYTVGNGCFSFTRRNYPPKHSSRSLQEAGKAVLRLDFDQVEDVANPHILPPPQRSRDSYSCHMGGLGNHLPLTNKFVEKTPKMTMLAMIRDPKMRLISSFADSMHHEGMDAREYSEMKDSIAALNPSDKVSNVDVLLQRFQVYMNRPSIFGCQVKMFNGHDCFSDVYSSGGFNHTALKHAIQVMEKDFYFIGLVEHFRTSLTLLYKMIQDEVEALLQKGDVGVQQSLAAKAYAQVVQEGRRIYGEDFYDYSFQVSAVESVPQRSSNKDIEAVLQRHVAEFYDPYDSVLYEEAKKLFRKRVRQYLQQDIDHNGGSNSTGLDNKQALKKQKHSYSRLRARV